MDPKECEHCPNNRNATEPFDKMKRLPIKDWKDIEQVARADGRDPNCFVCQLVHGSLDELERKD